MMHGNSNINNHSLLIGDLKVCSLFAVFNLFVFIFTTGGQDCNVS